MVVELLDGEDEVVHASAMGTVGPFAAVADAVDFVVEANRAAFGDTSLEETVSPRTIPNRYDRGPTYISGPLHAIPQHLQPMRSVIPGRTLIQLLKINRVLEGAVLDERALGDVLVILSKTHDEAEAELGVRVELAGAELDDVAHALRGAVLALDAVVGGGFADVRELEVDLVGDALHYG